MKFKFLPHTADIKFRAYGKNINELFENSAEAMVKAMYPGKIKQNKKISIKAKGKDIEALLYNFLEELLIKLDSDNFFMSKSMVKINKNKTALTADLFGDNAGNYSIGLDVKAVTYNSMFVKKINNKWVAQVVVDV
jgi:SHS2 domain-containing protein